jgi:hypothetical protein
MHLSFSIVYKSGLGNKTLLSTIGLTQLRSNPALLNQIPHTNNYLNTLIKPRIEEKISLALIF